MIEQVHRFSAPVGSNKIAPIRVTIKENTDFFANQIANAAKKLKDNAKYKTVYINPDLTQSQQVLLKDLIKKRNSENEKLDQDTDFRYGIRGDSVVKIKIKK